MTFRQLQDEALALKFNEGNRASVKSWLNLRYTAIWGKADWHFKRVTGAAVSVLANDQAPSMFSDFAKSTGLFDDQGEPLTYLPQREFEDAYLSDDSTGTPEAFTVVDRQIILAPVPSANATFFLSYLRRLSHVDGTTGLASAGLMVNDSDSPIWDGEYDYTLVLDAAILGCQLLGFPYADLVPQRDELLDTMIRDLVGGQSGELMQYGGH